MDQILIDASTVLFVRDLVEGLEVPNAINLLDLSSLIESIILHENITVLNSMRSREQRDDLTAFVNSAGGHVFHVVEKDASELLAELQSWRLSDGGEGPLRVWDDLFVDFTSLDVETVSYLRTLRGVFDHYWSHPEGEGAAAASSNALAPYATSPALSLSMARFVRRARLLPDTTFNEWYIHGEGRMFNAFAEGTILRTQFYLCSAEFLGMPYKSDALRWPLCWKLLTNRPLAPMLEERLITQAVKEEVAVAERLKGVLGAGVLAVGLPLLLRTVLRESSDASDILKTALQVRDTREARRFREFCRELREAVTAEDLRAAVRGLSEYTAELRRVFGESKGAEVFWNLLEGGAGAAGVATGSLSGVASAGALLEAATKTKGIISQLAQWWKRRRFALVTKALRQAGQARALNSNVKRIFGVELPEAELEILERLGTAGPPTSPSSDISE